jgi:acetylornithine deacetylase
MLPADATTWRARTLDTLDAVAAEMTELLVDLVRVPSVGGTDEENTCLADLARRFDAEGLEVDHWQVPLAETLAHPDFPGSEVERDEAWGLVGRLPGGDPTGATLMLNGHVDVVPAGALDTWRDGAPFSGEVRRGGSGDVLHGRGACDMKGGLVAAYWAVQAVRRTGVPLAGDLLLAGVQGEEDGGLGTFALLQRGWRADACVIPEPTSLDLVTATAGALTFRLTVPGHATHAARRLEGVSAIEKFWPVWAALHGLEQRRNATADPLMERWELPYPLSVGRVESGSWASSVPDLLVAEGRLGVRLDESVGEARAALEDAVAQACADDPWLRDHPVGVEWWGGQFASGRLPRESDLAHRVAAAHHAVTGTTPASWGAPYGSDLRLMVGLGGVPTLHYGPGDAALAHGPDEHVPLAEVRTAARALAVLALDVCGPLDSGPVTG